MTRGSYRRRKRHLQVLISIIGSIAMCSLDLLHHSFLTSQRMLTLHSATSMLDMVPVHTEASHADVELDRVKTTAQLLANDIVDYMLRPDACLHCRQARTMRRVVDDLSSRHHIVFTSIARKLCLQVATEESDAMRWERTFLNVASGLFADGHYNWGRVVTIYAFAGWLARQSGSVDHARKIRVTAGEFVAGRLGQWICQQGGWDSFERFFPEVQSFESMLWRGLLVTLIALAVLTLFVLAR